MGSIFENKRDNPTTSILATLGLLTANSNMVYQKQYPKYLMKSYRERNAKVAIVSLTQKTFSTIPRNLDHVQVTFYFSITLFPFSEFSNLVDQATK